MKPGDTILVQGVGGGVGTALMQLSRTMDVRVLGTAGKRNVTTSNPRVSP